MTDLRGRSVRQVYEKPPLETTREWHHMPDGFKRNRQTWYDTDPYTQQRYLFERWEDQDGKTWGKRVALDMLSQDERDALWAESVIAQERQRKAVLQTEVTVQQLKDMNMRDYADWRKTSRLAPEYVGVLGSGKSKYDRWKDARDAYANGTGSLDEVLKYVEEDNDRYDDVYQYRVHRSRWHAWWWLARWWHRRALGRRGHG